MLLSSVMEAVGKHEGVDEIYLHVQTSNEDAINFYSKHGFIKKDIIRNYYKRIEPPDCYILSKALLLCEQDPNQHHQTPAASAAPSV